MRSHLDGPLLEMKLRDAGLGAGGGELLLLELPLDAGQAAGQRAGLRLIHHLWAGGQKKQINMRPGRQMGEHGGNWNLGARRATASAVTDAKGEVSF